MTFEVLIQNVSDAIIDWDHPYSFNTFREISEGISDGRLKREDYEITYHIMGGVYDPQFGDYKMSTILSKQ